MSPFNRDTSQRTDFENLCLILVYVCFVNVCVGTGFVELELRKGLCIRRILKYEFS